MKKDNKTYLQDEILSYVNALRPIIYINHFDFEKIDRIIFDASKEENYKVYEWLNSELVYEWTQNEDKEKIKKDPKTGSDIKSFLREQSNTSKERFIVLKNINEYLKDPEVISWILDICRKIIEKDDYNVTLFIVSPVFYLPKEIEKYTAVIDIPFPTEDDINSILDEYIKAYSLKIDDTEKLEIISSLKGLSEFEIKQILNLAYNKGGSLSLKDKALILKEKEQIIKNQEL